MFSAMVCDYDARERQETYFNALRTLTKVRIILGVFQTREVTCRANGCRYSLQEEKKTDVNIAVEMLTDAINNRYDRMIIVSGDSDIQPAVEWVVTYKPEIKLHVYLPLLPSEQKTRRMDYYASKKLPVDCCCLPLQPIKEHQLKHIIKLPDGKFAVRPHSWAAPEAPK